MEGSSFPKLEFIDLNENIYTDNNTKGKIGILETWKRGLLAAKLVLLNP